MARNQAVRHSMSPDDVVFGNDATEYKTDAMSHNAVADQPFRGKYQSTQPDTNPFTGEVNVASGHRRPPRNRPFLGDNKQRHAHLSMDADDIRDQYNPQGLSPRKPISPSAGKPSTFNPRAANPTNQPLSYKPAFHSMHEKNNAMLSGAGGGDQMKTRAQMQHEGEKGHMQTMMAGAAERPVRTSMDPTIDTGLLGRDKTEYGNYEGLKDKVEHYKRPNVQPGESLSVKPKFNSHMHSVNYGDATDAERFPPNKDKSPLAHNPYKSQPGNHGFQPTHNSAQGYLGALGEDKTDYPQRDHSVSPARNPYKASEGDIHFQPTHNSAQGYLGALGNDHIEYPNRPGRLEKQPNWRPGDPTKQDPLRHSNDHQLKLGNQSFRYPKGHYLNHEKRSPVRPDEPLRYEKRNDIRDRSPVLDGVKDPSGGFRYPQHQMLKRQPRRPVLQPGESQPRPLRRQHTITRTVGGSDKVDYPQRPAIQAVSKRMDAHRPGSSLSYKPRNHLHETHLGVLGKDQNELPQKRLIKDLRQEIKNNALRPGESLSANPTHYSMAPTGGLLGNDKASNEPPRNRQGHEGAGNGEGYEPTHYSMAPSGDQMKFGDEQTNYGNKPYSLVNMPRRSVVQPGEALRYDAKPGTYGLNLQLGDGRARVPRDHLGLNHIKNEKPPVLKPGEAPYVRPTHYSMGPDAVQFGTDAPETESSKAHDYRSPIQRIREAGVEQASLRNPMLRDRDRKDKFSLGGGEGGQGAQRSPLRPRPPPGRPSTGHCQYPNCKGGVMDFGLCAIHYQEYSRHRMKPEDRAYNPNAKNPMAVINAARQESQQSPQPYNRHSPRSNSRNSPRRPSNPGNRADPLARPY